VSAGGRFAGRRAVVTGASRGIGAGIAQRLAAEGAAVAIVARTVDAHPTLPGSLTETAELLRGYGNPVAVIAADLADGDDRARIVPEAAEQLGGPLDILVNNAAAAMYAQPSEMPLKRRRITYEVNAHAPLDLAQAALPAMLERGEGWIVNVSSHSAVHAAGPGHPGQHRRAACGGDERGSRGARRARDPRGPEGVDGGDGRGGRPPL
jgi:NAD(P)-dependent dehydrogenase (short-subunit alcohol dehydrogenase family)